MRLHGRPLKVWQTPLAVATALARMTFLGYDWHARWQWRCLLCHIQCTCPYPSASAACDGAREHLADEHGPRSLFRKRDEVVREMLGDAASLTSTGRLDNG